jgi:hypothetical protein
VSLFQALDEELGAASALVEIRAHRDGWPPSYGLAFLTRTGDDHTVWVRERACFVMLATRSAPGWHERAW